VVNEVLLVPHIPFQLDYVEVLLGLADALTKLYDSFLMDECYK
jgi:hypothetical protein